MVDIKSLNYLEIDGCEGMECVLKLGECEFQNLEEMRLYNMGDLIGMVVFESASAIVPLPSPPFPSLKTLVIGGCDNIKRLGLAAWGLQNLEELEIERCSEMEEVIDIQEGEGEGDEDGEGEGEGNEAQAPLIIHLPKLKVLRLWNLPRLKTICKAIMVCTSIESISMWGCEGVKKLPIVFGHPEYDSPPSTLKEIELNNSEKEWWEALEMEHPSLPHLLQPFILWRRW